MLKLIQSYLNASVQTKMFYLMVILYAVTIAISTALPYIRLDYARSEPAAKPINQPQVKINQ